jgi:hypothetical protein
VTRSLAGGLLDYLCLVEALDLPQHRVAVPVEADVQALLLPSGAGHPLHGRIMAPPRMCGRHWESRPSGSILLSLGVPNDADDRSGPGSAPGSSAAEAPARLGGDGAEIRTFLIADVRGYTLFTHERGDEAAAKLAAKFASVAREGVWVI